MSSSSSSPSDFHLRLSVGDFIDCWGPSNISTSSSSESAEISPDWRVASISNFRNSEFFIHFDGFDSKYDEWIERRSDRIAPFKTRTGVKSEENPRLKPTNVTKSTEISESTENSNIQTPPVSVSNFVSSPSFSPPAESREILEFRSTLKVGTLVDIFSTRSNRWLLGEITGTRPPNSFAIINYSTNETETLERDSNRITLPMTKSADPSAAPPVVSAQPKPPPQPAPMPTQVDLQFTHSLKVGDILDCYDTERIWRLAEIIRADQKSVLVHYTGWSAKCKKSKRIIIDKLIILEFSINR